MTMMTMPRSIKALLTGFAVAFGCEAVVLIAMFYHCSLPWAGYLAALASLMANPFALSLALRGKTRGYALLKWTAAFSFLWTLWGGAYLYMLGVWAIALIAACVWLRVIALLMMRGKSAKEWINTDIIQSSNW